MATTALTVTDGFNVYSGAPSAGGLDVTLAAADVANGNHFIAVEKQVVLASNTDSGAHTITLTSVADRYGRVRDITGYSVGAGKISALCLPADGYKDATTGKILISANDATVKFGVLRLPAGF